MTAAKRDVPHYYVDATVDVTRLLELRREAKESVSATDAPVTAYLIRAASLALDAFPRVNAAWLEETVVLRGAVNVGLAVSVADDGLVVPVVKGANAKTVAQIASIAAGLIVRARDGTLTLDDMSDGTFTISSLGGFAIDTFHAVVNPPESAILAVGAIRRVPAVVDEQLVVRDAMQLSLSADHRVFSGATAAAFLTDIRRRLEQPLGLLL
jgi:pyruvate dehydrogenase E2 component (dihydrolipoamide acetyltransferase)